MNKSPKTALLLSDPGVLESTPLLEFHGWHGVKQVGGLAVLPWKPTWNEATADGIKAQPVLEEGFETRFRQCAVHLQKGRPATWANLGFAWRHLEDGGQLLFCGSNALGVKSAIKKLERDLGQVAEIVTRRAKGRVARFVKDQKSSPERSSPKIISLDVGAESYGLLATPGVFSSDAVDPASELLIEFLANQPAAKKIFDPGCGVGALGLAGLLQSEETTAVLADADHRAVDCSRINTFALGLESRCEFYWWDALSEPPPLDECDLAVVNPPFHTGVDVDLDPARAMFKAIEDVLAPGGRALIVANQTLPYERDLRKIGTLEQLEVRKGFKLLQLTR